MRLPPLPPPIGACDFRALPCYSPAAKGLYDVMKTNLGPKGTIKMLVGGAGGGCCCGAEEHRRAMLVSTWLLPLVRARGPGIVAMPLDATVHTAIAAGMPLRAAP